VTISGDVMRQFNARNVANPKRSVIADIECEGGGGVMPYQYQAINFVNTLQWAIGLELFLLVDDPWRVFFTTDSPNGAPFTRYPELVRLLMDADYREATLATLNPEAAEMTLLKDIKREYSLYELAITTRAAPAKLMGLPDRGHLGVGAIADIAVYTPNVNFADMFASATWLFKKGLLIVKDGEVLREPSGEMLTLAPIDAGGIETELQAYFDDYFTMRLENIKVHPHLLGSALNQRIERIFTTKSAA